MIEQSDLKGRFITILVVTGILIWAFLASGIKLGQDLEGGTTLRFSLDIEKAIARGDIEPTSDPAQVVTDTIKVIDQRINASGLAETNITPLGDNKFEISLPSGAASRADYIAGLVTQLGDLRFQIEVLPDSGYERRLERKGEIPDRKGVWPKLSPSESDEAAERRFEAFKKKEVAVWQAARDKGVEYRPTDKRFRVVKAKGAPGSNVNQFHILEETGVKGDRYFFDGGILVNPVARYSAERGDGWVVVYDVKNEYQNVFAEWTGRNIKLPMAIVLNKEYHSAPTINSTLRDSVQITLGNRGTPAEAQAEAEQLATVLQTGSLKVQPTMEAQTRIGASLAGESRNRGILSIVVAFLVVLLFMFIYYRSTGMVANIALLLNLVLLVGFLAFFQAVLTLPGIAGIVLTVGMAVDANILINERIREEIRGGRSLRRAVSEGYDRALSAIVDANVTSIITAIFLFKFGSGPVRGFAITLAIGLLVSMFTAIFVTRTIVEWLLHKGWLKKLGMLGTGEPPRTNWISLRRLFIPVSVSAVVAGLAIFVMTDKYTLYDVDFTGGYKAQAAFHKDTTVDDVKRALGEAREVTIQQEVVDENGRETTRPLTLSVGPFPSAQVLAVGTEDRSAEIKVQRLFEEKKEDLSEEDQSRAFMSYIQGVLHDRLMPNSTLQAPSRYVHPGAADEGGESADPALTAVDGGWKLQIGFRDTKKLIKPTTLETLLKTKFPHWQFLDGKDVPKLPSEVQGLKRDVVVRPAMQPIGALNAFDIWIKTTASNGDSLDGSQHDLQNRLDAYLDGPEFRAEIGKDVGDTGLSEENFGLSAPFRSTDVIGSSVAQRLKNDAMLALVLSLLGIIIYIAIRFRSRAMGFAAVLCLFHDVAITLGLVSIANSLGIVDAKINLAMVAAFLTLVGYSVNDTVVIFDRIRENRGKRPDIDAPLINLSINQTLARTIKTSATFLLVCLALFAFNIGQRNVLEGFAFLLILGSVIGTYSTIAISSPLLLYLPWLWERVNGFAPPSDMLTKCLSNPLMLLASPIIFLVWLAWWLVFAAIAFVAGLVMIVPWALGTTVEGDSEPAPAAV